jgi:hypothetical protein
VQAKQTRQPSFDWNVTTRFLGGVCLVYAIERSNFMKICLAVVLVLSTAAISAYGQTSIGSRAKLAEARALLVNSTEAYKESSLKLLHLQEEAVRKATLEVEKLQGLLSEGLVARRDVDEAQQKVAVAEQTLVAIRQQIAGADQTLAEITAEEESARSTNVKFGKTLLRPTVLRFSGPGVWSLATLNSVQTFFSQTFGRPLPTSAVGQSAIHNLLGWDHRNAVDVGLHPDSAEGKALITYLQSHGIPFLAFRSAIPGVATGPHIHIGQPSHRISS